MTNIRDIIRRTEINKAKEKIKSHFPQLSIHEYICSRNFELLCMKFDMQDTRNQIIKKTGSARSPGSEKNEAVPSRNIDDALGKFLSTLYDNNSERFYKIIREMVWNYSEWSRKNFNKG